MIHQTFVLLWSFRSENYSPPKYKGNKRELNEEYCVNQMPVYCPSEYRYPTWIHLQIQHCNTTIIYNQLIMTGLTEKKRKKG